jgi:hypothetical protein
MSGAPAEPGETAQDAATRPKTRRARRQPVLKGAKIISGPSDAVTECQIHDESPFGVLAVTGSAVAVPERVTIKLSTGALVLAVRRWENGNKIGFEFAEIPPDAEPNRQQMRHVREILETQGLPEAIHVLRASRFFNNTALRHAAEDVEAAQRRLEALLK